MLARFVEDNDDERGKGKKEAAIRDGGAPVKPYHTKAGGQWGGGGGGKVTLVGVTGRKKKKMNRAGQWSVGSRVNIAYLSP
jgi:hypothetical protein